MKLLSIVLLLIILIISGCATQSENSMDACNIAGTCNAVEKLENSTGNSNQITVDKIEVYHFHGATQCFSCKTIKKFAEKTVNTYYSDLLESGKMEFRSIDGELSENGEVVMAYGATGSSLWIGTYIDGKFHKEQNINVWYKVNDEENFTSYLKELLDRRLAGDLS